MSASPSLEMLSPDPPEARVLGSVCVDEYGAQQGVYEQKLRLLDIRAAENAERVSKSTHQDFDGVMRELEAVRMANSELHLDVLRRRRTGVMLMLKLSSAEEDSSLLRDNQEVMQAQLLHTLDERDELLQCRDALQCKLESVESICQQLTLDSAGQQISLASLHNEVQQLQTKGTGMELQLSALQAEKDASQESAETFQEKWHTACTEEQERSSTIQQLDTTRELLATATAAALAAAEQRLLDAQALGAAQLVAAQACSAVELAAVQASSAALLATARAAEAALSARVAELDGVAGEGQRALETLRGCQRTLDARCVLAEERAKVAELSLSEWRGLDGERKRITVQREENLALISKERMQLSSNNAGVSEARLQGQVSDLQGQLDKEASRWHLLEVGLRKQLRDSQQQRQETDSQVVQLQSQVAERSQRVSVADATLRSRLQELERELSDRETQAATAEGALRSKIVRLEAQVCSRGAMVTELEEALSSRVAQLDQQVSCKNRVIGELEATLRSRVDQLERQVTAKGCSITELEAASRGREMALQTQVAHRDGRIGELESSSASRVEDLLQQLKRSQAHATRLQDAFNSHRSQHQVQQVDAAMDMIGLLAQQMAPSDSTMMGNRRPAAEEQQPAREAQSNRAGAEGVQSKATTSQQTAPAVAAPPKAGRQTKAAAATAAAAAASAAATTSAAAAAPTIPAAANASATTSAAAVAVPSSSQQAGAGRRKAGVAAGKGVEEDADREPLFQQPVDPVVPKKPQAAAASSHPAKPASGSAAAGMSRGRAAKPGPTMDVLYEQDESSQDQQAAPKPASKRQAAQAGRKRAAAMASAEASDDGSQQEETEEPPSPSHSPSPPPAAKPPSKNKRSKKAATETAATSAAVHEITTTISTRTTTAEVGKDTSAAGGNSRRLVQSAGVQDDACMFDAAGGSNGQLADGVHDDRDGDDEFLPQDVMEEEDGVDFATQNSNVVIPEAPPAVRSVRFEEENRDQGKKMQPMKQTTASGSSSVAVAAGPAVAAAANVAAADLSVAAALQQPSKGGASSAAAAASAAAAQQPVRGGGSQASYSSAGLGSSGSVLTGGLALLFRPRMADNPLAALNPRVMEAAARQRLAVAPGAKAALKKAVINNGRENMGQQSASTVPTSASKHKSAHTLMGSVPAGLDTPAGRGLFKVPTGIAATPMPSAGAARLRAGGDVLPVSMLLDSLRAPKVRETGDK